MIKWLVILISVPLMAGCASDFKPQPLPMVGYRNDPNKSQALNIATAMGIKGLSDARISIGGSNITDVNTINGATYAARKVSGVSGLKAGLGIFTSIVNYGQNPPYAFNRMYAFIPKSDAPTKKALLARLNWEVTSAFESYMSKQGFRKEEKTFEFVKGDPVLVHLFVGNGFDDDGFLCRYAPSQMFSEVALTYSQSGFLIGTSLVKNPPYFAANNGPTWIAVGSSPYWVSRIHFSDIGRNARHLNQARMFLYMSKRIKGMYFYLGAKHGGPIIFHDGKVLPFVKPPLETASR